MMSFEDYLLHVFYRIDTELGATNLTPRALRSRGSVSALADSEVLTIEVEERADAPRGLEGYRGNGQR